MHCKTNSKQALEWCAKQAISGVEMYMVYFSSKMSLPEATNAANAKKAADKATAKKKLQMPLLSWLLHSLLVN
jgi:hypothetical protein